MRSRLVASLLVVSVVLCSAACTRNDIVVAETLIPPATASVPVTPVPKPPSPAPAPPDDPLPRAVGFAAARSQADAPKLGSPCVDPSLCGTKRRVAVRVYRHSNFRPEADAPCKLHPTMDNQVAAQHYLPSACVAGERLYVGTTCIMCRTPEGTAYEAELAELTPQQIANLQSTAGFEGRTPPLRTASEWRSAIEAASPKVVQ